MSVQVTVSRIILASVAVSISLSIACTRKSGNPSEPEPGRPPEILQARITRAEPAEKLEGPFGRKNWERRRRSYPGGALPQDINFIGWQSFRALTDSTVGSLHPLLSDALIPTWKELGPAPLDYTQSATPNRGPAAGRTTAFAIHPTNSSILYSGWAMGGVWKSTDAGVTWKPLTESLPTLAIGAITIDPNTPETIYVGTGEANFSGDAYVGQGLYKSINGGQTWTFLGQSVFTGLAIAKIGLDGAAIYVAAAGGSSDAAGGCDGLEVPKTRKGLYKSTDGGATFVQLTEGGSIVDFEIDTSVTPRRALISKLRKGLFLMDEATSPPTLTPIPTLPTDTSSPKVGRIEIERSKSNPSVYFAGVGLEAVVAPDPNPSDARGAIFVSSDAGVTWSEVIGAPNYCKDQCDYDNVIAVHPTTPGTVYFGGASCGVYKLTNALTTPVWAASSAPSCLANPNAWTNGSVHADVHALVFDPHTGTTVFAATDGGLAKTVNSGTSWTRLNGAIATNQFYKICVDPNDPTLIVGGMQDNGFARKGQTTSWSVFQTGDGTTCANNLGDPVAANQYMLTSTQNANVQRTNGAGTVTASFDPGADRVGFVPPITNAPSVPTTAYVGTYRVWRSTQSGKSGTWQAVSPDVTAGAKGATCTDDPLHTPFDDVLTTITVAPSDANRVYTGSSAGKLFVTKNGSTWANVTGANLPNRFVSAIAVDPTSADVVYATFSGFNAATPTTPGHVFRSIDGGTTWARFDTALDPKDLSVNAIAIHPHEPGIVYLGTDFGVLVSPDAGGSWLALGTGLPNVAAYSLDFHAKTNKLYLGTHGRSAWVTEFVSAIAASPATLEFKTSLGVSPPAQTLTVSDGEVTGSQLAFTATAKNDPWLSMPTTTVTLGGARTSKINVALNTVALAVGAYDSKITISAPAANNPLVEIPVHLVITAMPDPGSDSGVPASDSGLPGSDSGLPAADGGAPFADSGAAPSPSGSPAVPGSDQDSGAAPAATASTPAEGCGCVVGAPARGPAGAIAGVLALAGLLSRRRRVGARRGVGSLRG